MAKSTNRFGAGYRGGWPDATESIVNVALVFDDSGIRVKKAATLGSKEHFVIPWNRVKRCVVLPAIVSGERSLVVKTDVGDVNFSNVSGHGISGLRSKLDPWLGPVLKCFIVDGAGWAPPIGARTELELDEHSFIFLPEAGHRNMPLSTVRYERLSKIDIQGYTKRSSAGIVGGGFGARGALEGMAAATIANALTTRSSAWVIVAMHGNEGWVVLRIDDANQADIRNLLRPARDAIVTTPSPAEQEQVPTSTEPSDLVSGLERLANLHDQGFLSDLEFTQAKQALIQIMSLP